MFLPPDTKPFPLTPRQPVYLTDLSWEVRNRAATEAKLHPWMSHCRFVLVNLDPDFWRCELCLQYLRGLSRPKSGQQSLWEEL